MTTYAQATDAADELVSQVQGYVEDGRFVPRFFDRLFALRTRLGAAAEAFARSHGSQEGERPLFALVLDRCGQAAAAGGGLAPVDAAVDAYARAVKRAIDALEGAGRPGAARAVRDEPPLDRPDPDTGPATYTGRTRRLLALVAVVSVALAPLLLLRVRR